MRTSEFSNIITDEEGNEYVDETKTREEVTVKRWTENQFVEEIQKINDQIQELNARKATLAQQQNKFKKGG